MSEFDKQSMKTDFSDDELARYSRQIMLPKVDVSGQLVLVNSTVLIVGVGGLGSAVAQYLAAAGVGCMILADHDIVEASNLQRQVIHSMETVGQSKVESAQAYIAKLNPCVRVVPVGECLEGESLAKYISVADLVIDCSDNFQTRKSVNSECLSAKTPLVSGAAIRFEGQLTAFDFRQEDSPCYQCLFEITNDENLTCSESGVVSPLVGIIGCAQAMEAIKILLDLGLSLVGRVQFYDAMNAQWREFRLKKNPHCKTCSDASS